MREKILISDINILYICPSDKWGALERRVINDCQYFRDIGGSLTLYCSKDSPIDKAAEKYSIPRIFYKGKKVNQRIDFTYFFDLRKILKENNFDIVHSYNINFTWVVALILRSMPNIPLILTFNRFLSRPLNSLWQKWLFKRIDLVITFSNGIRDLVVQYLPIQARKVHNTGIGLEYLAKEEAPEFESKVIATILTNKKQEDNLKTFLYCAQSVVQDEKIEIKNLVFKIYCDQPIDSLINLEKINSLIKELAIEGVVEFVSLPNLNEAISQLDIYISLDFYEPFCDFEILSAINEKPAILPRTAGRTSYLSQFSGIGETYYFQDSREMKTKLLHMLSHQKDYKVALRKNKEKLLDHFGLDSYVVRLHGQYIRLHAQRVRYATKASITS